MHACHAYPACANIYLIELLQEWQSSITGPEVTGLTLLLSLWQTNPRHCRNCLVVQRQTCEREREQWETTVMNLTITYYYYINWIQILYEKYQWKIPPDTQWTWRHYLLNINTSGLLMWVYYFRHFSMCYACFTHTVLCRQMDDYCTDTDTMHWAGRWLIRCLLWCPSLNLLVQINVWSRNFSRPQEACDGQQPQASRQD